MPLKYHDWDDGIATRFPGEGRYTAEDLADKLEDALAPLALFLATEKPGHVWFPPDGTKTEQGDEMITLQDAHDLVSDVMRTLRRNRTETT